MLTDNRMNFSAVIACLQHLGIDSMDGHTHENVPTALEKLGVFSTSPVSDLESCPDDHGGDVFDWTELRRSPGWSRCLFDAFNR